LIAVHCGHIFSSAGYGVVAKFPQHRRGHWLRRGGHPPARIDERRV
jgi:hypothetical protein